MCIYIYVCMCVCVCIHTQLFSWSSFISESASCFWELRTRILPSSSFIKSWVCWVCQLSLKFKKSRNFLYKLVFMVIVVFRFWFCFVFCFFFLFFVFFFFVFVLGVFYGKVVFEVLFLLLSSFTACQAIHDCLSSTEFLILLIWHWMYSSCSF